MAMYLDKKTVVIVEDEQETAEMLAEMMQLSGFRAFQCLGGKLALQMIFRERPDAVLLDLMMPDLPGLDVLRLIRGDPRLEKIPVIIVSARCQPIDIQNGLNAGANAYLTKPVGYAELKKTVAEMVSLPGTNREAG